MDLTPMATNLLIMPQAVATIEVRNNEVWNDGLAYYDNDMNPISLAGIDFVMEMRRHAADKSALVSLTSVFAGGLTVENDNELHFRVPLSQMKTIPCTEQGETYKFDVVGSDGDDVRVVIVGTVKVILGVTR